MAKQTPNGTMKYWHEATSCNLIKGNFNIALGTQDYWYNGQPQGFLLTLTFVAKPRYFGVLLNF